MDEEIVMRNPVDMPRRANRPPVNTDDTRPTMYIGQWIRALSKKPRHVAKAVGMNEGYLSQLNNNKGKNPSSEMLKRIADHLGIPVDYFYFPPPARALIDQTGHVDPHVLARLWKPVPPTQH